MAIVDRLQEILKYSNLSVRAFAIKCGISQTTLDKQIKGLRSISIETVMSVLYAFPEVSAEWLMRGNGEMLIKQDDNSVELARINGLVDTITTLNEAIKAKTETNTMLMERIKQLENQLKK